MCLLTFLPTSVAPDPTALLTGAEANPHGHGFAIIDGDRILTGHSMNGPRAVEAFTEIRAKHPGPALFHSRYATRGAIDLSNCHPFPVGGDRRIVLAHNGTLPKRVHPRRFDSRSDTRIAAEDYLPDWPFGSLDTHRGLRGFESWLGRSKMVILTVDPGFEQQVYLLNENLGQWDSGIWYSNTSYLAHSQRWPRHVMCRNCDGIDYNRIGRFCHYCGWCFACENRFPHCECRPTRRRTQTSHDRPARLGHGHAARPANPHADR